jgi:hypothetical protein
MKNTIDKERYSQLRGSKFKPLLGGHINYTKNVLEMNILLKTLKKESYFLKKATFKLEKEEQ